ncbi:MAG: molybdopterin-dependent oxidoreductase [Thermincola sp.]|nr:molybdopterin-dependent oxidoreductase [Thermincola sp.]MDT3702473.1 molybdopterin-dependent oxidoreductase [Thermincola sp.]
MTHSRTVIENGVVKTSCSICPMSCGMDVYIKDGRISEVKGMSENAYSKGFLCPKGRALPELVYNPNRITKPMLRQGSTWKEISWDEAMNLIVANLEKLKADGEEKSLAIAEGMPLLLSGSGTIAATHRFAHAFGTPNTFSCESYCYRSKMLGYIATLGQFFVVDPENAACIIVWASDPDQSTPPQGLQVWQGKKNGAKTVVINPIKSKLAAQADHFLQPIPGTDGSILLAMMHVIIGEELYDKEFVSKYTVGFNELVEHVKEFTPEWAEGISTISAGKIREIARLYATTKPACIMPGTHGLDAQASGFQNNRAIAILQAITGNVDVRGGFIQTPRLRVNMVAPTDTLPENPLGIDQYPILYGIYGRNFGEGQAMVMVDAILTGKPYPIKTMIVAAANPVVTWPNAKAVEEALRKVDFLVVMEQFMTKTARLAHLVLPAATFAERDELSDYYSLWGSPYVMMRKKVLEYGECRSDLDFWIDLARRMGYNEVFPWQDTIGMLDYMLEPSGLSYEALTEKYSDGFVYGKQRYKKYEEKGFKTPSGKIEIFSQTMKDLGLPPLPVYKDSLESKRMSPELAEKYPLILTTGARRLHNIGSRLRNVPSLRQRIPDPVVEINPVTAEQYGLADGDMAVVENDRAQVEIKVKVTEAIMSGVIHIQHGWEEANVNLLTNNFSEDVVTGYPVMKGLLCTIRKKDAASLA